MSILKKYKEENVLDAATKRISFIFDNFEKIYISYSAGKDSTTMLHLVMAEAQKRNRKIGLLLIDLEAQYNFTIEHAQNCIEKYKNNLDIHWVCLPIVLRNAVSNYEPRWMCWDTSVRDLWVREYPPNCITDENFYPFFRRGMEFEEFVAEFGDWYAGDADKSACFVGIRTDESLNRFRTIASKDKVRFKDAAFTTLVSDKCYNVYPIYDWAVSDIWLFHYKNPLLEYNKVYDYMFKAGLTPAQMRICQPYGDDQRRGLWLYHILEPQTWYKIVARVNGANTGALYVQEKGNASGYNKISKPEGHTWKSFCELLLNSLPEKTSEHYKEKFSTFLKWWNKRGYPDDIPDEAPAELEAARLAPSYRRMCKVLLRNDYWCKGLCFTQPFSETYGEYLKLKKARKSQSDADARQDDESTVDLD